VVFLLVETKVYATDDSAKNCLTFPVNEVLSVRLYRDNKPNCLETSLLQKGLVLVYKGKELIEEGMGFGVPVVKFQDKTLFSSNAQIIWGKDSSVFEKHFLIDTISTKQFCNAHVNDNFYEVIHKMFEKGYLGHQTLQPVNNKIMELRSLLKIKTHFKQVKPRGTVKIKYAVKDVAIEISADFSGLNRDGALEFLLLNEQGASSFGCYKDTDGLRLADSRIGAWDLVSAKKAVLTNRSGNLGFSLEPKVSTMLFRGWEKTRNRFSWAGLSYSLPPSRNSFYYYIELNC
jgi:hypothetical protein